MLFDSVVFLFTFLPAALILYYLTPKRLKNITLLFASLIFYAWGGPVYLIVMTVSILFNYVCGLVIGGKVQDRPAARARLTFCLAVNLILLAVLQYGPRVLAGLDAVLPVEISYRGLGLPIGMSFYTLQILSYIIDVYRGEVKAQKNPLDFMLYAVMFPKIPAGPVVRYSVIEKQLKNRRDSIGKFGEGAMLFIRGLAKKVLLADNLGQIHEEVTALLSGQISAASAWLGCAAFALQIYYGLSGYSDMAVGLGKMFGFELPENFDYPFTGKSFTEYWYRWHLTLGAWFREYVYRLLKGDGSILLVWILVAIWHGGSWNLLAWGFYCGVLMIIEKDVLWKFLERLPGFLGRIYSIVLVLIGWVFFFSEGLGRAFAYLGVMFGVGANGLIDGQGRYLLVTNLGLLIIAAIGSAPFIHRGYESIFDESGKIRAAVNCVFYGILFLICIAYLVAGSDSSFMYLRF